MEPGRIELPSGNLPDRLSTSVSHLSACATIGATLFGSAISPAGTDHKPISLDDRP